MTNENTFCQNGHQPEDYSHFERMTINRRPWGDLGPGMMLGECLHCCSSISYPKGPSETSAKPICFEPRPGLDLSVRRELERIQARNIERMTDAHTDGVVTVDGGRV
jgi:hypothetical protein